MDPQTNRALITKPASPNAVAIFVSCVIVLRLGYISMRRKSSWCRWDSATLFVSEELDRKFDPPKHSQALAAVAVISQQTHRRLSGRNERQASSPATAFRAALIRNW